MRSLREEQGLTQATIVGRLQRNGWDISRHVYGFIEDGSRALTDLELFAMLQALGRSPRDLETGFRAFCAKPQP
ncbi:MAG: helix-turn-helix transcriptional regulator [Chthoniobacterales bacterium]|nr:helix-turn-helix transcriptional regulator [Chthoniobacterales bacterium]